MARRRKVSRTRSISRIAYLQHRLNLLPRSARIGLAGISMLGFVSLAFLILNGLFPSSDSIWIGISIAGMLAYGLGWMWLVGFDWDVNHPWEASRASAWYSIAGVASLLLSVVFVLVSALLSLPG